MAVSDAAADSAMAKRQVLALTACLLLIAHAPLATAGAAIEGSAGLVLTVDALTMALAAVVLWVYLLVSWVRGRAAGAAETGRWRTVLGLAGIVAILATVVSVIGRPFVAEYALERPKVAELATAWGVNQRTTRPLIEGTRPIVVVDEGNLAEVCRLSGWPPDARCARTGLSPRLDYGSHPQLLALDRDSDGYIAVMNYVAASDRISSRWLALRISRGSGSWYVEKFADVPLSVQPDLKQARAVLANTLRCAPGSLRC